jgi:lysostaphin
MRFAGTTLVLQVFVVLVSQLLLCQQQACATISVCQNARQGQTIEIKCSPLQSGEQDTVAPKVNFNGKAYPLFPAEGDPEGGVFHGLLAVPADLNPGIYQLKVAGEETTLKVEDGKFPVQHIRLPKSKDNFDMSPGEKEAVEGAKACLSEKRLWQGRFVVPSKFRQSARFGMKRVVNGRLLKDYFHTGLDFAAPLGSPVFACAKGKVILARTGFKLHGNIVAIDHGQGVVSFYIHLQKIKVDEGQLVAEGEQIGTVGQTGRATGPHLHFSIYVNETASNPSQWFTTIF